MLRDRNRKSFGMKLDIVRIARAAGCVAAAMAIGGGCSSVEKAPPRPRPANAGATMTKDLPEIMRGTISSSCWLDGWSDVVVRDYGFVVGLKGTGHRTMDAPIRAFMLEQMARMGVGSERSGYNIPPEQLLDSLDTAVVIVEAIIPAGSPMGTRFDVRVSALANTETTSLEGGTLWTTELRPALAPGRPPVGPRRARTIARAYGQLLTNPFVSPDSGQSMLESGGNLNLLSARILGGGVTLSPLPLKLRLVTPSHNIASILQQVINSQFPQEPGQMRPTAWGEGDESIEVNVPPSYHDDTREFVKLLEHTTVDRANQNIVVQYINRMVRDNPGDADHASWRWQAIGRQVLPAIKEFYTSGDEMARYGALRAGARLNDAMVIPHLIDLAKTGSNAVRKQAIELLGDMRPDAEIIVGLQPLLSDPATDVRIAAYEALANSRTNLVRPYIVGNKFRVDVVESDRPLVYIALFDEPRIVIFGRDLAIKSPMSLGAWSNRFLMKGDAGAPGLEVAYRDEAGTQSIHRDVSPLLREFVAFLGHTTTIEEPRPGLGLTYGETIGVLHALHRNSVLARAEFMTEADRIRIDILEREATPDDPGSRPIFAEEDAGESANAAGGLLPESEASAAERDQFRVPN